MALIQCPECGKQISDKAPACINCGCPVSAMKTKPAEPAKPRETVPVDQVFQEFFSGKAATKPAQTAAVKTVPKVLPEMKLLPGLAISALHKLCGMAGYAGVLAVGSLLINVLNGEQAEPGMLQAAVAGIVGAYVLVWLAMLIEFLNARKFIRKNGYEDSIRNDTPQLTNSLNAYGLYPSKMMARYINHLNPVAGKALLDGIAKGTAKKRKERLSYVPYLAILVAVYYLLPRYSYMMPDYDTALILAHIATLVVMAICGHSKPISGSLILLIAMLFAPTVFAYYYSDMWYHILICAAAAVVGMCIGIITNKKKEA